MITRHTPKDPSEANNKLVAGSSLHWFHWVIILSSLILTLTAWQVAVRANDQTVQARFDREAGQAISLITERMENYEQALWAGVAAFSASEDEFTVEEWRIYSDSLDIGGRYPGINGIGVIEYVPRAEIGEYLSKQRIKRPEFKVFPEHSQNELWPITYLEPYEANAAAIGLDMAHEANRYNAAVQARNTGKAQITAPIFLVQDEKHTPGFLFFAPDYRVNGLASEQERIDSFERLVYAPFIFEKLLLGTLDTDQRLVSIRVTDNGSVLYDELSNSSDETDSSKIFTDQVTVDMYGREWTFDIRSNAAFAKATSNKKPWIVLVMGLLIETTIIVFFIGLARAKRRAISLANAMSRAHEEKADQLENIRYNSIDGIILCNERGEFISANKAAEELFDYSSEEIIGLNFSSLFPGFENGLENKIETDHIIAHALPGTDLPNNVIEVLGTTKTGQERAMEISISKIIDKGVPLYNLIVRDVSARKEAEARLNKTMDELVKSNEDLEKFAYIASHDLKSPLRAIDKLCQWIYEDMSDVLDEENAKRFEMVQGRIARLQNLLTSLLMYSRAGHEFEQTEFGSATALLQDVIKVQNIPIGFNIELAGDLDEMIVSRMPLGQVFTNLVDNAVKHHEGPDGHIRISGEISDDKYIFRITDNGPGIEPEMHERIFEMFQTLRRRDEVEGAGMGLALVKKMLLRHGGHIEIESQKGEGATFIVTWPVKLNDEVSVDIAI